MAQSIIGELSMDFAIRIVNFYNIFVKTKFS